MEELGSPSIRFVIRCIRTWWSSYSKKNNLDLNEGAKVIRSDLHIDLFEYYWGNHAIWIHMLTMHK